jgi:hypothetical protein
MVTSPAVGLIEVLPSCSKPLGELFARPSEPERNYLSVDDYPPRLVTLLGAVLPLEPDSADEQLHADLDRLDAELTDQWRHACDRVRAARSIS